MTPKQLCLDRSPNLSALSTQGEAKQSSSTELRILSLTKSPTLA